MPCGARNLLGRGGGILHLTWDRCFVETFASKTSALIASATARAVSVELWLHALRTDSGRKPAGRFDAEQNIRPQFCKS